jgi:hypothetical protein
MSIQPYNSQYQTTLVPQTLLGYSDNGVSAIEITPTAITIAGDLNTPTPIYVGISASTGLTTTLTTGLDVNCSFNMNDNDINNVNTINGTTDLTLSASDIYTNCQGLQLDAGTYINLNSTGSNTITGSNVVANTISANTLTVAGNVTFGSGVGGRISGLNDLISTTYEIPTRGSG